VARGANIIRLTSIKAIDVRPSEMAIVEVVERAHTRVVAGPRHRDGRFTSARTGVRLIAARLRADVSNFKGFDTNTWVPETPSAVTLFQM
jgi:hypothetical protein